MKAFIRNEETEHYSFTEASVTVFLCAINLNHTSLKTEQVKI